MVDIFSTPTPLTVTLPADLVEELYVLAKEQGQSVDEVVREACLEYTEPFFWARVYKESQRSDPVPGNPGNGKEHGEAQSLKVEETSHEAQ